MTEQTPDLVQDLIDSFHKSLTDHCHWCQVFRVDYAQDNCPDHIPGPTKGLEPTIEALEQAWIPESAVDDAIIHLRFYADLLGSLEA